MIEKLVKNDNAKFQGGCDALLDSWTCPPTGYEIAAAGGAGPRSLAWGLGWAGMRSRARWALGCMLH